eukprot:scaffold36189_cov160-Amphora_coffeaeformis.AAC.2
MLYRVAISTLLLSFPVQAFVSPHDIACCLPRHLSSLSLSADKAQEDDDWHPRDPAHTTPQLLAALWHQIAQAGNLVKGETMTVLYPQMEEELQKPTYLNLIMAHLDVCKDVCDHYGMTTTLVPYQQQGKLVGFTAKSFRNPDKLQAGDDGFEFNYDPFWDDGTDFDNLYAGIDAEEEAKEGKPSRPKLPEIENPIPDDDAEILRLSKQWVQTFMSDMGICPFASNADSAGLPVGPVQYEIDRSTTVEDMYTKFWEEVVRVEQQPEKAISTILLICPEFYMDNVELFEEFSNSLTRSLPALKVDELIQLVFFHPHWSFRDGGERTGAGMAANYARRSPWPMINILRTSQVRKAQKGIPTGLVYKQNEKTLGKVGAQDLEVMLRLRDWDKLADFTVNRREFDALKIARDFQETGAVSEKDMSLAHDATPAANKVDRKQVEEGDLVNVLKQALEKRLGKGDNARVQPLSGPETSATAMATEFLIQELGEFLKKGPTNTKEKDAASKVPPTVSKDMAAEKERFVDAEPVDNIPEKEEVDPLALDAEARRQQRYEEARRALLQDITGAEEGPDTGRGDEMTDVLFGRAGIKAKSDEDDDKDAFNRFAT